MAYLTPTHGYPPFLAVFQPQFHHGTHVYLILDVSHKDNYLYPYSPAYTVIWSKILQINFHGRTWQISSFLFPCTHSWEGTKSTTRRQILSSHWRTTMKCNIKALWRGKKFQGAAVLKPSSSVTCSRTQSSCLWKTTNRRALQTTVVPLRYNSQPNTWHKILLFHMFLSAKRQLPPHSNFFSIPVSITEIETPLAAEYVNCPVPWVTVCLLLIGAVTGSWIHTCIPCCRVRNYSPFTKEDYST